MLQKKTLQQTASLLSLKSSLQHYTPKAVEKVLPLFKPFVPEGVTMPDVALVLELLVFVLVDAGTQVVDSNWQRHEESLVDLNLRDDRDDSVKDLRPIMFRVRDIFRGALGPKGPRLLALDDGVETLAMPPPGDLHVWSVARPATARRPEALDSSGAGEARRVGRARADEVADRAGDLCHGEAVHGRLAHRPADLTARHGPLSRQGEGAFFQLDFGEMLGLDDDDLCPFLRHGPRRGGQVSCWPSGKFPECPRIFLREALL
jgi:hypothetical protein